MYTTNTRHSLRFPRHAKTPSFSSIHDGERKTNDMKFYHETTIPKKQNRVVGEELTAATIRGEGLLEKWKERGKTVKAQMERKSRWHDQDVMFFSSNSSSSYSSSGLLFSSDKESLCFAPTPGMTSASNEEGLIKSKSRALKIYNNLKKVKQPISPGGRLRNFLNSLFATRGNVTKTKTKTYEKAKAKSGQVSTCPSASSYSRSCLSKASKDKLQNEVKRTVRFYPVTVIVDEECRPCGHKRLYEEDTRELPVSVPTAWNNQEQDKVVENRRRVEEAARQFLKDYRGSHNKKSDLDMRDFSNVGVEEEDDDDEEEEDAASYSSSDLFELDHLSVMGNNRYLQELPVYETTHVTTNRAIANRLI